MIKVSHLCKRFGSSTDPLVVNDISFEVQEGSLVTLLGPSGCGKTTTMRLIAGLERPSSGSIYVDGECMSSEDSRAFQPVDRRPIGMVFQSYAIWPHLTVAENVAFPLRVARPRIDRKEIHERVMDSLALVGLDGLADRPAPALSGGQQQRVALARALVRRPKILLLDEPLSNLDAELRDRMRDEIRAVQQRLGITTVFVTHDQSEALAMSDEIIIMNAGNIVERGVPEQIYDAPRRSFTASFLGVSNVFAGTIASSQEGVAEVLTSRGTFAGPAPEGAGVGAEVLVALRPDSIRLSREASGENGWKGKVTLATYHGQAWIYHVDLGDEIIKVRATRDKAGLKYGDEVYAVPELDSCVITYDGGGVTTVAPVPTSL